MGTTTFSGPVVSRSAFKLTAVATVDLPAASPENAGEIRLVNDNGVGDNEHCIVISTGAAWVTATGAALT